MGDLKKIKTTVEYRVPAWHLCNHMKQNKDKCRFCVKHGAAHVCVLYNEPLAATGWEIAKCEACYKATAYRSSAVTDEPTPSVEPKVLMKLAIDEYIKVRNSLLKQGYPAAIADTIARKAVLE